MIKVKNDEQANEAIKAVAEYLSDSKPTSKKYLNELATADRARKYCYDLLDATKADGMCGCPLCKS